MKFELIDRPLLSPDIEWLLQTDQASDIQIVEAFVGEYFATLSQMVQVMLPNPAFWTQALETVFATIFTQRHMYQPDQRLLVWVDAWCFRVCQKLRRQKSARQIARNVHSTSQSYVEERDVLSQLPLHQNLALFLNAVQDLSIQEIAEVTRVKPKVASGWLTRGKWQLTEKLYPNGEGLQLEMVTEEWVKKLINAQWQALPLPILENRSFTESVVERVHHSRTSRRWRYGIKENVFAVAITIFLLCSLWFLYRSDPEPPLESQKYVMPQQEAASPQDFVAPVLPPSLEGGRNFTEDGSRPLSIWSGTNTIINRVKTSEQQMDNKLIEAHIHFEGFLGYDEEGVDYAVQTWMDQSRETQLNFTGPANGIPFEMFLMKGSRRFVVELDDRPVYQLQEIKGGEAVQSQYLRDILFNPPSLIGADQIFLRNQSLTLFGGREVLSVDQYGLDGRRIARFWLDIKTGFPIRQQLFSRIDDQRVILDVVISGIKDQTGDTPGVFSSYFPWITEVTDGGGVYFNSGLPISSSGKSALAEKPPGFSSYRTPPADLDLTATGLSFQFARTWKLANQSPWTIESNLAWIFAGPYYIGQVEFGTPWQMICSRSPDGYKLAFVENPNVSTSSGTLHWFSLQPFKASEQLDPIIPVSQLAFAPDSRMLAFFSSSTKAIYLLDTDSGVYQKLFEFPDVRSLVWRPDGTALGFIGRMLEPKNEEYVMVVRTATGEVTYRRSIDYEVGNPGNEWPMLDWNVEFPVETNHLEWCSLPVSSP